MNGMEGYHESVFTIQFALEKLYKKQEKLRRQLRSLEYKIDQYDKAHGDLLDDDVSSEDFKEARVLAANTARQETLL